MLPAFSVFLIPNRFVMVFSFRNDFSGDLIHQRWVSPSETMTGEANPDSFIVRAGVVSEHTLTSKRPPPAREGGGVSGAGFGRHGPKPRRGEPVGAGSVDLREAHPVARRRYACRARSFFLWWFRFLGPKKTPARFRRRFFGWFLGLGFPAKARLR